MTKRISKFKKFKKQGQKSLFSSKYRPYSKQKAKENRYWRNYKKK